MQWATSSSNTTKLCHVDVDRQRWQWIEVLPELMVAGVSTWSVFAVLATLAGVLVAWRAGRAAGFHGALLAELAILVVVVGWLSAKIAHVLFEADGHELSGGRTASGVVDLLREDPWHWARLFEPGFVFYGGVVGAVVVGWWFLRRRDVARIAALCDIAVPGILVGIVLGRIGCFLGACCYGAPTELPWAVHFAEAHATHGVGVHPVQLYDAVVAAAGLVLWAAWHRRRRDGAVFFVFCGAYAVARALTELVRADADRGAAGPLSTSQLISFIVLAALLPVAVRVWRTR